MKKPLLVLSLLAFSLPFGCKVEEDTPPDPLAKASGFCDAWAKNACQADVLMYCNAPEAADCESTQSDFCRGIVPENYTSSKYASECLKAVKAAYKDATLTAAEIDIVIKLGAPCDKLSKGSSADGEACEKNDDCNTAGGFGCIIKADETEGTCGKPEEVGPGEACDGPTQVCGEGNFCNGENCVAYKKTGGSCEGDYQCKPEDHCLIDDSVDPKAGACEVRAELSADCASDDDCQSHLCVMPSGETVGKCASTIRLSVSEPLCENLR
jgi:hypothetical protein